MTKRHAPRGPIKGQDPMKAGDPMEERLRCTATNRQGRRCGKSPIPGGTVCRMHGGAAPQVQLAARARLLALQPKAIQRLDWLLDREEFPSTMYQAIKDVMDRTEGRAPDTVDMNVSVDWEKRIARIKAARKRVGEG